MRVWLAGKPILNPGDRIRTDFFTQLGDIRPHEGPVFLRLRFVYEAKNPRGRIPLTQPALPGLVRGALDVLNGTAWLNEKQIAAIHAVKEYGNVSGTEILW